jgi:hypothetical protein
MIARSGEAPLVITEENNLAFEFLITIRKYTVERKIRATLRFAKYYLILILLEAAYGSVSTLDD